MSHSIKNLNLDQFRFNRRSGQSTSPTLTSTPRGSVFGSLMPPMESTDINGLSKARDIEMNNVDASPEINSGEKLVHASDRRAESVESSALGHERKSSSSLPPTLISPHPTLPRVLELELTSSTDSSFMRCVKVFNLVTAAEVILFCAFSLIFHNVKLEGEWHEVSRLRLFDAVPITYLIQALFVIFEIVGVNALQGTSHVDLRVQRVRIHYWRGITTFCRFATPIVAALIIIGHRSGKHPPRSVRWFQCVVLRVVCVQKSEQERPLRRLTDSEHWADN